METRKGVYSTNMLLLHGVFNVNYNTYISVDRHNYRIKVNKTFFSPKISSINWFINIWYTYKSLHNPEHFLLNMHGIACVCTAIRLYLSKVTAQSYSFWMEVREEERYPKKTSTTLIVTGQRSPIIESSSA